MTLALSLVLALLSAGALNWAYYRQHGQAAALPPLSPRHPVRSLRLLFGDVRWLVGFVVGLLGWVFYVAALRFGPLSLVQAASAGGIGVLALLVRRWGGVVLSRREWAGVAVAIGGLAALGLSLVGGGSPRGSGGSWLAVAAWLAGSGVAAAVVAGPGRRLLAGGAGFGVAAGLLYAAGDVATKAAVGGGWRLLFVVALLAAHGLGFVVLQLAFQRGTALTTAGAATLFTNAVPIAAGTALFHEPVPGGVRGVFRVAAFVAVVAGAVLLTRSSSSSGRRGRRTLVVPTALAIAAFVAAPALASGPWAKPADLYVLGAHSGRGLVAAPAHRAVRISARLARLVRVAPAYGWPLKPFGVQHPVRGNLDDPRFGSDGGTAFHFGVDVAGADGTPVYAVVAGTAHVHAQAVVLTTSPTHEFGYWHIRPAVAHLSYVRRHQLVGWILRGWGHVHFAERLNGRYLNPLRPGGMGPYVDRSVPRIAAIAAVPNGGGGGFQLAANAYDLPSPAVPRPWGNEPVAPAFVQWRVVRAGRAGPWRTAADFRAQMLDARLFHSIYAPPTVASRSGVAGQYWIYLARAWRPLAGGYRIEVAASDVAGNRVVVAADVKVSDSRTA